MGSSRDGGQMASQMQNRMREGALRRQEMGSPRPAFGMEAARQMAPTRPPEPVPGRSGIIFGPGRASRLPEQGSPEYQQLIQRVRGLAQMK